MWLMSCNILALLKKIFFFYTKMRRAMTKKESQRQTIEFLWNKGIRNAKDIRKRTDISFSTIYDNIRRLKETGTTKRAHTDRQSRKITTKASRFLKHHIRQDPTISTRTLSIKLCKIGVEVSHTTVGRHLAKLGYEKSLPTTTPMLTPVHKQKRIEWAKKHLDDDWEKTLFTDETAFQLF